MKWREWIVLVLITFVIGGVMAGLVYEWKQAHALQVAVVRGTTRPYNVLVTFEDGRSKMLTVPPEVWPRLRAGQIVILEGDTLEIVGHCGDSLIGELPP